MNESSGPSARTGAEAPPLPPGRGVAAVLGALCLAAAAAGWALLREGVEWGDTAMLGAYRERWFLVNVGTTYAAIWMLVHAARPLRPRAAKRILLLHGAAVIVLAALELAALAGFVDYRELLTNSGSLRFGRSRDAMLRRWTRPGVRREGMSDQNLTWLMGAPAPKLPYSFATDSHGLRNKVEKPDPRIVCVGDSFLVAGLVPVDEILTERLERLMQCQVLNVSEGEYAPIEEFERLKGTGISLAGRTVLHFVFEGNDLGDTAAWHAWRERSVASNWPQSGLAKTLLGMMHSPVGGFAERRRGVFAPPGGEERTVYFYYDGRMIADQLDVMDLMMKDLAAAAREVRAAGGKYALVRLPTSLTVMHPFCRWPPGSDFADATLLPSPFFAAFERACAREGIPVFDAAPALEEACRKGRLPYFEADTHMNSTGHEVVAEALVPWIRGL